MSGEKTPEPALFGDTKQALKSPWVLLLGTKRPSALILPFYAVAANYPKKASLFGGPRKAATA